MGSGIVADTIPLFVRFAPDDGFYPRRVLITCIIYEYWLS